MKEIELNGIFLTIFCIAKVITIITNITNNASDHEKFSQLYQTHHAACKNFPQ